MTMLVAFLQENPGTLVTLQGHLDQQESRDQAATLRDQRARAVREALLEAGVASDRIRLISGSEGKLVCSEQAESCWELNRRVEVKVEQSSGS
jgi:peptidoglycan-associated lipoprotein